MKKIIKGFSLFVLSFLCFVMIFTAFCLADEKVAEGKLGDTVTFEIYNSGSTEKPVYTMKLSGTGTVLGVDNSGNELKYKTREDSVLKPYSASIVRVDVGEGIEEIGSYGLAFLPAVKEIYLPGSVTVIGNAAFQDCTSLERIVIAGDEDHPGFNLKNIVSIKNYAFSGCRALKKVTFSENLTGLLGKQCFAHCPSLTAITVPAGITAIGSECFKKCTALCYVEILGTPTIESSALSGAPSAYFIVDVSSTAYGELRDKDLPYGGNTVGDMLYGPDEDAVDFGAAGEKVYWQIKKNIGYTEDSPKYDLIVRGSGDTLVLTDKWGKNINFKSYKNSLWAPYLDYIVSAKIEANIKKIEGSTFVGFSAMEQIEIPRSLTELGGAAFEHCKNLSSIYLAGNEPVSGVFDLSSITAISAYCFDGCSLLKKVIFSENLDQDFIGQETFKNCTGLTSFTVPAVIKKIEKNAFLGCENLTEVIFELDASINDRAFDGCSSLKTIRGFSDSEAEIFAKNKGIDFLYPCLVAMRLVGSKKLIENIEVVAGQCLDSFEIGGEVCLLYTDPEGNEPFDIKTPISSVTTLYAEPIYRLSELSVRASETLGLRAHFSALSREGNKIYSVIECGAIASKDRGTSGVKPERFMSYTYEKAFFDENSEIAPYISLPNSGEMFTYCATGFEGEDGLIAERCAERIYFRGYVIIEDKKSGERYTFYTDVLSASLYSLAKSSKNDKIGYSADEIKRLEGIVSLSECEKQPMSRDEALEMVGRIVDGELDRLLSGTPATDNENFFNEFLGDEYERNGDVPALVRFNVNDIFDAGFGDEGSLRRLSKDIAEYALEGGSVLLYLRPDNPTNENNSTSGRLVASDWDNVMTVGNPYYKSLMRQLGKTGMLVQFLKEEGVTVFVSLLPDISTENRWWCAPSEKGGDVEEVKIRYRELWKMCADYMEKDCSLSNIIWIFEGGENGEDYYPGSDYADIYGSDFESSGGKLTLSMVK